MKRTQKKPGKATLADRLVAKLRKLGVSEKKATAMAKSLTPLIRSVVNKAVREETAKTILEEHAEAAEDEGEGPGGPPIGEAIPVNGHSLRLDLPVAPMKGAKGIEILQVMDGLSSSASYLVAAVKGQELLVAVRELGPDCYNVKFYPTMLTWGFTREALAEMGAEDFLQREPYERAHFTRVGLDSVLDALHTESKPRTKSLMSRFLAITARPLVKAFLYLHQQIGAVA